VIDPAADGKTLDLTIPVVRAPSRVLHFVRSDGSPVSGLMVQGLAPSADFGLMRVIVDDSEAEVVSLEWAKPREITASSHDGKYIARTFVDVLDPQPRTIQLVEAASISGRVLDASTGLPIPGCLV